MMWLVVFKAVLVLAVENGVGIGKTEQHRACILLKFSCLFFLNALQECCKPLFKSSEKLYFDNLLITFIDEQIFRGALSTIVEVLPTVGVLDLL